MPQPLQQANLIILSTIISCMCNVETLRTYCSFIYSIQQPYENACYAFAE